MAEQLNVDAAKSIGQDRQYADAIDLCEAQEGVYDASRTKGTQPSQSPLPNTPSPFRMGGAQ